MDRFAREEDEAHSWTRARIPHGASPGQVASAMAEAAETHSQSLSAHAARHRRSASAVRPIDPVEAARYDRWADCAFVDFLWALDTAWDLRSIAASWEGR